MYHGGKRQGAGRKPFTPAERAARAEQQRQIIIDELIWPGLCSAMHADPGTWKDGYLQVELSKTDLKRVYKAEGLREWCEWFSCKKIGGMNRHGVGYKTTWTLNLCKFGIAKKIAETFGHTLKDLPHLSFPSRQMEARLAAIKQKSSVTGSTQHEI